MQLGYDTTKWNVFLSISSLSLNKESNCLPTYHCLAALIIISNYPPNRSQKLGPYWSLHFDPPRSKRFELQHMTSAHLSRSSTFINTHRYYN